MDAKSQELLQEESLSVAKDIRRELQEMMIPVVSVKMPKSIEARISEVVRAKLVGDITIEDRPFIDLGNEFTKSLESAVTKIVEAVKESQPEAVRELSVKNIGDAKADSVKVTNLGELEKSIDTLTRAVLNNQPIVNVEKQDITLPRSANEPIPVRLSDGKSFYNAIFSAITSASGETDVLTNYQIAERDDTSATKYYGYAKPNGEWYILRESSTGSYRYSKGARTDSAGAIFSDAWTNRVNLTYDYIYEVF